MDIFNFLGAMGRKILQAMPNLATKTDENGWTPLHYASHFDKVSLAEELLKNDESAAYKADKVGNIPRGGRRISNYPGLE